MCSRADEQTCIIKLLLFACVSHTGLSGIHCLQQSGLNMVSSTLDGPESCETLRHANK